MPMALTAYKSDAGTNCKVVWLLPMKTKPVGHSKMSGARSFWKNHSAFFGRTSKDKLNNNNLEEYLLNLTDDFKLDVKRTRQNRPIPIPTIPMPAWIHSTKAPFSRKQKQ